MPSNKKYIQTYNEIQIRYEAEEISEKIQYDIEIDQWNMNKEIQQILKNKEIKQIIEKRKRKEIPTIEEGFAHTLYIPNNIIKQIYQNYQKYKFKSLYIINMNLSSLESQNDIQNNQVEMTIQTQQQLQQSSQQEIEELYDDEVLDQYSSNLILIKKMMKNLAIGTGNNTQIMNHNELIKYYRYDMTNVGYIDYLIQQIILLKIDKSKEQIIYQDNEKDFTVTQTWDENITDTNCIKHQFNQQHADTRKSIKKQIIITCLPCQVSNNISNAKIPRNKFRFENINNVIQSVIPKGAIWTTGMEKRVSQEIQGNLLPVNILIQFN
ncbi:hypothetical protein ABPG72_012140 [Tetrahymena utriculariae]